MQYHLLKEIINRNNGNLCLNNLIDGSCFIAFHHTSPHCRINIIAFNHTIALE